jgi:putative heme-binding domain-containing protein
VADERERITNAEQLLIARASDAHPRVRTEAVRGLSFFPTSDAMAAIVVAADVTPADRFVAYTADAALGANMPVWKQAYDAGTFTAKGSPASRLVDRVLGLDAKAEEMRPHLEILTSKEPKTDEERNKAMQAIAMVKGGNPINGKAVFRRVCINCHKVGNEGAALGPEMTHVGRRLDAYKIVESIVHPNAVIEEKYLSTAILTDDGRFIVGLLESETPEAVVILDGKGKTAINVDEIEERSQLKQSSMPEGLASTLSPNELLDVVEYLKSLR